MNIQSSTSGYKAAPAKEAKSNLNPEIKQLMNQKEQLKEQIQHTKESKMDDKLKQERIKLLEDQITQIDSQIMQIQRDKLTQSENQDQVKESTASQRAANHEDSFTSSGMSHLLQAGTTYDQAKIMKGVQKKLNGEITTLSAEMRRDNDSSAYKQDKIDKMKSSIDEIDKKFADHIQNTLDHTENGKEQAQLSAQQRPDEHAGAEQSEALVPSAVYKPVDFRV